MTLACEIGGRWDAGALAFMDKLVTVRARRAPSLLQAAAARGWQRRWWSLLSVAVQDALAATLIEDCTATPLDCAMGFCQPLLDQVLDPGV